MNVLPMDRNLDVAACTLVESSWRHSGSTKHVGFELPNWSHNLHLNFETFEFCALPH